MFDTKYISPIKKTPLKKKILSPIKPSNRFNYYSEIEQDEKRRLNNLKLNNESKLGRNLISQ